MTEKQKRFVDEYCVDLNATQAAIRAGYSRRCAGKQGLENLQKPYIKSAIDERLAAVHTARVAQAQEVEEYLTRVLRGESESDIVVIEGQGDGVSLARAMKKNPDERERLKAAEVLAKRWGLLTDKVKLDGLVKTVIVDDLDG